MSTTDAKPTRRSRPSRLERFVDARFWGSRIAHDSRHAVRASWRCTSWSRCRSRSASSLRSRPAASCSRWCSAACKGQYATLVMIMLSVVASGRYMYWRLTETTYWEHPLDAAWGLLLVSAEVYSTIVLMLGYFQTAWPLKRKPMPLPASRDQWPTVDVFIPTYNEPLSVVKPTIYAALALDYPADKIAIHVLDDGRRPEFKAFCEEIGVNWTIRTHNRHAKAGNINEALKITKGEYLADLRLRPHSDALVPADRPRLVPARQAALDAADAAPLLLARSVRTQSRHVPQGAERRRTVLRPRAGRQRPLERDLLLRLVRAACAGRWWKRSAASRWKPSPKTRTRRSSCTASATPPPISRFRRRRASRPKASPATSASGFAGRAA